MDVLLYLAITFTIFLAIALLSAPVVLRPSPEAQRILEVVTSNRADRRTIRGKELITDGILKAGRDLRARLGMAENVKLKKRLLEAGLRDKSTLDIFFAVQLACPLLGCFAGSFIPDNTAFWVFALAVVGYMAPDFWLTKKTSKRRHVIRRSIPDCLDLLVICVDAGLGLDQALIRVSSELSVSHPEINEELNQVNLEQRAGKPRLEAWQGVAERTQIEEFKAFVSMLVQTDKFGTPILKALSQFSEEIRMKRRQHAEEAAAKTKIKIIFPLVLCIFPCVFIVLLAPAILSIMTGFKAMGH
ncbi:tight adherence protein C [Granulicella aggregans]|uniref:Tight adherence protein C n=1 Tax=Granulicella aggregans TaxID=474949 RepID=A0A7W7ZAE8_9BACT|nr:type II secretion system F family protein [Granulicella aggregans]MBB5056286.1 tight adherence protein C [Granulicella aggregans]